MPTKQTAPLRSLRAAAMVIISSALYPFCSGLTPSGICGCSFHALAEAVEIFSAQDMPLDPRLKRFAFARDHVPTFIEGVVARVVALRIGRKSSTFHNANRADHP